MKIVGIGGTNGSGKDTVGHYLAKKHKFLFVSVTELLRQEAKRRDQPVDRDVLREISAEWRREIGLGVLVDRAVLFFEEQKGGYSGLAIASLRNPGEADRVHELGGIVVWVDADQKLRYDRIQANAAHRNRAEEDNKSFEQFIAEEEIEMSQSGDEATLNMSGVKAVSDVTLLNESENFEILYTLIDKTLG
ncbi:MAG: hypothetical protein NVS1B7_2200 [Candidatus Saccharimonadales bacterium]